jgi:hypothetical protein
MQTVEMYFNDTIAKYSLFKQAATSLVQEIPSLPPIDIFHRCEDISALHKEATQNKDQLFIIMEFMGPGILDTSFIGEFQRVLDKSILVCDTLYVEILNYKDTLISCTEQPSSSS